MPRENIKLTKNRRNLSRLMGLFGRLPLAKKDRSTITVVRIFGATWGATPKRYCEMKHA